MKKFGSIIFYLIAITFLFFYAFLELSPEFQINETAKVIFLCLSCIFLYFGGFFLSKYLDNNKPMKINLWIFMTLYLLLFINLTLFDTSWRRNGLNFIWNRDNYANYLATGGLNLRPFKTIMEYINLFDSLLSNHTIVYNLLGNVVCTMPLAFFLPLLFAKQNKWYVFFLTILAFIIGIESIQLITCCGTCDIDDVILNTAGAMIMYGLLKLPEVKKLIHNIFFLEKNKLNYKKLAIVGSIIGVIVLTLGILISYRSKLYNKNLGIYSYKINIVDESESCDTALELFYEDEIFKYYFSCIKSDNVYGVINENEKYLVKDLLNNNPTDYKIDIERLEHAGLKFIREEKYSPLQIPISKNVISYSLSIDDNTIASYKTNFLREDNILNIYIIPYEVGKTYLNIEIDNKMMKYEVSIDDNFEITFLKVED